MKTVLGSKLSPDAKREALASFVHRYTRDHKPRWVAQGRPDGSPYPLHFDSDADWLANTFFSVMNAGALVKRRACYSTPTWPDNPELRVVRAPCENEAEETADAR